MRSLRLALGSALILFSCQKNEQVDRSSGLRPRGALNVSEWAFRGAPGQPWRERGVVPRTGEGIALSETASWALAHPTLSTHFESLTFRFRAPLRLGDFLEVRLDSMKAEVFPRVRVRPEDRSDAEDGWNEVLLPFATLNPKGLPIDQIVFRSVKPLDALVEIDEVGLVAPASGPKRNGDISLDCSKTRPISPWIYGVAYRPSANEAQVLSLGPTIRKWGGAAASRFNWELGNAWNAGAPGKFRNALVGRADASTMLEFLTSNADAELKTALTVPIIGWVAKDARSTRASDTDPPLFPPQATSTVAPPEFIGRWISTIKKHDEAQHLHSVDWVLLDHEPSRWHEVHHDLRQSPVTAAELVDRTERYAQAIRAVDADVRIAGPCERWQDLYAPRGDRNQSFADSFFKSLATQERTNGTHVLDGLDVHLLPEGLDGPETEALATRRMDLAQNQTAALLAQMREWSSWFSRPLALIVGEYRFGGENEASGGLAIAEALGQLGREGTTAAFLQGELKPGTPAYDAFRAFQNYDGRGARFPTTSIEAQSPERTSAFAAIDPRSQKMVIVALNLDATRSLSARLKLSSCATPSSRRVFHYLVPRSDADDAKGGRDALEPVELPPSSITVIELAPSRK